MKAGIKKVHYKNWKRELPLYIMILPAAILVLIFSYGPMGGIIIAFKQYLPTKGFLGSDWAGLYHFEYMFKMRGMFTAIWNTVYIALMKIIAGLVVPVVFALLLNEVKSKFYKRSIQTLVYLPYFLSWVIISGMLIDILSPSTGIVNQLLGYIGIDPIFFLGDLKVFPYTMVITDTWKSFGFGTIVYLAALTSINPLLYEASVVDGANRWKQTLHITLPGIIPIIVLMTVLSLGSILNAGFEQIFNLYSPQVFKTGDIIDTMVYRIGILESQYSLSTAVGLFKSVVSTVLIIISYRLADKFAGYKIF